MKKSVKNISKKVVIVFCILTLFYSCKNSDPKCEISNMKVKDIDNNVYGVIKIGNQYWLQQNLRCIHYNDSTSIIPIVETDECCTLNKVGFYADFPVKGDTISGKFYNWHAVNTGKLAPKGWHVATKSDWEELKKFIGPTETGSKLRATNGWNDTNTTTGSGTDDYCFSALATGYKNWGNTYWPASNPIPQNNLTVFWTSTRDTSACIRDGQNYPYSIIVGLANKEMLIDNCNCHNFEYSVRCVKDSN